MLKYTNKFINVSPHEIKNKLNNTCLFKYIDKC